MPTVREILESAGLDQYQINSLDSSVLGAFQNVLSEAENQKIAVDQFWSQTYSPSVAQWEQDKQEMARRIARAEGERAALLAERNALAESGVIGNDPPINVGQTRNARGEYVTPGTPTFGDANDFVARASTGLAQLADVDWKHRNLFNAPLPISPSELVRQADAAGLSPAEFAERKFGFSKKEQEERDNRIRQEARAQADKEWSERTGQNPDVHRPSGSARMSDVRRAVERGERPDPTRLTPEQRRAEALKNIHRAVEEREQRDA